MMHLVMSKSDHSRLRYGCWLGQIDSGFVIQLLQLEATLLACSPPVSWIGLQMHTLTTHACCVLVLYWISPCTCGSVVFTWSSISTPAASSAVGCYTNTYMHGPGTAAVVLPQQVQHTTKLSALSAQGTVWLQCSMV